MIKLDYFQEFGDDSGAPTMRECLGILSLGERTKVGTYLDGGVVMSAVPGYEKDVLDGSLLSFTAADHTDGTYVWPHHLRHYVVKYGVGLRANFVAMVMDGNEPPTELSADQADDVWAFFRDRDRSR